PDFARTVDIHRKPGYDPVELYLDPNIKFPRAKIAWTLAKRKLGQRGLMEVIPLDAALVKGSHGRAPLSTENAPLIATSEKALLGPEAVLPTEVCQILLRHLTA